MVALETPWGCAGFLQSDGVDSSGMKLSVNPRGTSALSAANFMVLCCMF
jgi:hypothetical protein